MVYNSRHQLAEVEYHINGQTETQQYTYSPSGKRLTKTTNGIETRYTYNTAEWLNHTVTSGDSVTFVYDQNGNRTGKTDAQFKWDYAYDSYNRLISAKRTDSNQRTRERVYEYTAKNQRARVWDIGMESPYFIYDGKDVLIENGGPWKILYNPGICANEDGYIAYPIYDHSGNSVVEIWPEGGWHTPFHLVDYDEFGIKRKGSSEILTQLASSMFDPFTQMFGISGFDSYTMDYVPND